MLKCATALCLVAACAPAAPPAPVRPAPPVGHSVVILVWDGLRPDAISAADTPNLARLRDRGVDFTDNHSTYPTFTMMNAASFATGAFPDVAGYYGNVVWQPGASGNDSAGKPVDFRQPVFSEDYAVLDDLAGPTHRLLLADTLFGAAQAAGLATATVGKSGAAYLQDMARGGSIVDEKTVLPIALARELQAAALPLPPSAPNAYAAGELVLGAENGNPVEVKPTRRLKDAVTADPTDDSGTPFKGVLTYLVRVYLDYLLPQKHPRLSVVWLRDPDSTQHAYGIGTANWHDALRTNDHLLGDILAKLDELGLRATTDILIVSDHGHSNVSGPQDLFPLREVRESALGEPDPQGHAASGMIRIVDLLRRAGFTAFDGLGCTLSPVGGGVRRDGATVYPVQVDRDGSVCGKEGQSYQAPPSKVPAQLPPGALVVAVNGGSEYVYVPDHDAQVVKKVITFLQERAEVGAIFVDERYGAPAGTLALRTIHAQSAAGRNPDIIFSYDYDDAASAEGMHGTEMAGMLNGANYRGMHGSFSPRDVHNVLIASGPDFRTGFKDPLPTGNVDVAPTVAHILGVQLPQAQGRALLEALAGGASLDSYRVEPKTLRPQAPATGLTVRLPTDPDGKAVAPGLTSYTFELHTKSLAAGGQTYTYYDFAKATRR